MLKKVIQLIKPKEGAKIARLPAPRLEKFLIKSFSIDNLNSLHTDKRREIPASLHSSIMSSKNYRHTGASVHFQYLVPKLLRGMITMAKCCEHCNSAGKIVKLLLKQLQIEKYPESIKPKEKVTGSFQNAEHE